MSRVGKKPIPVPKGVDVQVDGKTVRVKGPKGTLERRFHDFVHVSFDKDAGQVVVTRSRDDKPGKEQHGLWRALVSNMVDGVTKGTEKTLEIIGVGYKAELQGKVLKLSVGFATPVEFVVPDGLTVETGRGSRVGVDAEVKVSGIDNELVGQFAAKIRSVKPPDSYKGKGIRYRGEYVRKLAGKTFGTAGA
ncbi:MAG: 50S ribosomal protein L6 [Planctomycetota bacterium]|jgi:large subunit ribosomal protein L6